MLWSLCIQNDITLTAYVKREISSFGAMPDPINESKVRVLLRIPAKLKARLAELAEQEHRSLNKQIEFLLDRCIREGKTGETDESERVRSVRGKRK